MALQPDVMGDMTTELERELGKIVKEKYKTDFYVLYRYPLAVCPPAFLSAESPSAPVHAVIHYAYGILVRRRPAAPARMLHVDCGKHAGAALLHNA